MKPGIEKEPVNVPQMNEKQLTWLTDVIFGEEENAVVCDAVFVFGGTHPGHWEKAVEIYEKGLANSFIVTGGISPTGVKHRAWENANIPESTFIKQKLIEAGIVEENIFYEDTSRNTVENVTHAMKVFDFSKVKSLLVVCKAHGAGRQIRTLQKYVPDGIKMVPYAFPAVYNGVEICRDNWHHSEKGRVRVWGEYLRICTYGDAGHLQGIPVEERMI
ncbi:YdcF family protein [Fictibacillus nanhaiensis]|uniref:YdcF family protein n=1 Tax=Fictibacillus nanhaiensis TaxID=742169 RepID=UPI001C95C06D|nr:YdcF family protein [Fictibacillus nanhaiensis]MBY6036496.1 YdcF family protein [Fictibacillus nanhaiensis]